ncbi:FtsX-like permease family protein [Gallibacterium anatis]
MTIVLYLRSKQHQIAAWRIFGAPRTKIVLLIWSTLFLIITCALMLGTLGGIVFAYLIAHYISQNSGFALPVHFSETEA